MGRWGGDAAVCQPGANLDTYGYKTVVMAASFRNKGDITELAW
jgi:hypothetical protein